MTIAHLAHAVVTHVFELAELLGEYGELYRLANLDAPVSGMQLALDELEQRRLARAIGAQNRDALPRSDVPLERLDDLLTAKLDTCVAYVDDLLAQTRHGRAAQFDLLAQRRLVGDKRFCCLDAKARLGRARRCTAGKPGELAPQDILAFGLGDTRLTLALHALHDVRGIAALERRDDAIVHLPHVEADLVEKPTVVRDEQKRALAIAPSALEVLGKPVNALYVQMVGGFVHHEDVVVTDEHAGQVDATTLATRKRTDLGVPLEIAHELGKNRTNTRIARPFIFGSIAHDRVTNRVAIIERVPLSEHANRDVARAHDASTIRLGHARQELEKR